MKSVKKRDTRNTVNNEMMTIRMELPREEYNELLDMAEEYGWELHEVVAKIYDAALENGDLEIRQVKGHE